MSYEDMKREQEKLREEVKRTSEDIIRDREELAKLREGEVAATAVNSPAPGGAHSDSRTVGYRHSEPDIDDMDPPQHALENPEDFDADDLIEALEECIQCKLQEAAPSEKQGAPKSPPKGYPTSKDDYADPTNFKYPLETEKHVRAALSYFSKKANRSKGGYSPAEQKFMWGRILRAAKKYGIELSPDVSKRAEQVATPDGGGEKTSNNPGNNGKGDDLDEKTRNAIAKIVEDLYTKNKEQAGAPASAADIKKLADDFAQFKDAHAKFAKDTGDTIADIKTKNDDAMKALTAKMENALKEAKEREGKLKEQIANNNPGALVATLKQIADGAIPSGHNENAPQRPENEPEGPVDFVSAMDAARRGTKPLPTATAAA
jgi:hypothetical protein